MSITEPQAAALANLLHEIRPDWPAKSIRTLIDRNQVNDFTAVCQTAVTVAADSRNQTPAVIFLALESQAAGKATTGPWTPEFHQFKTASEKSFERGQRNHDYFAQLDREREQEAAAWDRKGQIAPAPILKASRP